MRRLWQYHRGKLFLGLVILTILFVHIPYTKALYKSAFLMLEIFPNSSLKPQGVFTKEPILKEVIYGSGEDEIHADLWIPNEKKQKFPAAVLHLGLDIDRKDERVAKLAEAISRTGVMVLAPNIPSLSNRRLTINTPRELMDSANYLKSLDITDHEKLGFFAFCAAGGPAYVASQDKDLKDSISYIVTINPFYDLNQLFVDISTRKIEGETWNPSFKTVEIVNRETISGLDNEEDIEKLSKLFVNISPDKLSSGTYHQLENPELEFNSRDSLNTYLGIINKDSLKSRIYLKASTEDQKTFMDKLSPSKYPKSGKQKTFVLSEIPNPYVPFTHARSFKALGNSTFVEVDYTIAYKDSKPSIKDIINSWYFVYRTILHLI